jgi:sialic acid synthase SpsE
MKAGEIITESDFKTKRPGSGIPSIEYKNIIGKSLKQNILENQMINWEDIDANPVC